MAKRAGSARQAKSPKKGRPGDTEFSKVDSDTDVCFDVEKKKLYFSTTLLRQTKSPTFATMFPPDHRNADREGDMEVIRLVGKKFKDMLAFLKLIHPVYHTGKCITDATLLGILQLTNEYQVDSVRKTCTQYIDNEIQRLTEKMSVDRLFLYFIICDEQKLVTQRKLLLELLKQQKMKDIKGSRHYRQAPQAVIKELAVERSLKLESIVEKKVHPLLEQILSNSDISSPWTSKKCTDQQKCDDSDDCTAFCQRCARQKIHKIASSLK